MIEAVIFDFDGVIVDTMPTHFATWRRLSLHLGYDLHPSLESKMRGASRDKSLQIVLDYLGLKADSGQKSQWSDMKHQWYQEEIEKMDISIVLPGIIDLLDHLRTLGLKTAVASASKNARAILKQIDLDSAFDIILDANDIAVTKPDPAVFLEALQQLRCHAEQCFVIEDSPLGIDAARGIHCRTIGIGSSVESHTVDYHFERPSEINFEVFSAFQQ